MKYKLFHFNAKDKSNWGDYQLEIGELFNKCRKTLVECLGLKTGFILLFLRKGTSLYEQVMALLQIPTDSQRGYYWSVVIPAISRAASEAGQNFKTYEELHLVLKNTMMEQYGCYIEKSNQFTGKVYREALSVSNDKGNKNNSAKYIDTVINWAAEFYGIVIPEPKKD